MRRAGDGLRVRGLVIDRVARRRAEDAERAHLTRGPTGHSPSDMLNIVPLTNQNVVHYALAMLESK